MTKPRKNRNPEQIVRELAKADQLAAQGNTTKQLNAPRVL
jgi:hypothetical protein